ncbi:hypothetical protein F5Y17DRAFT_184592 [Xylariaceae sp. FL0594]|nr:hypothetical protein F5Y17DRAFT_184592 [Xylariaceae sp. FL0594]
MSFQPAKRQRSDTSRESSNVIPQTSAPALRQLTNNLALYSTTPTPGTYSNGAYGATQPNTAPSANHHAVSYAPYSASPVTGHHNGYGSTGYQNNASAAGYGGTPYSPQHQTNPYAAANHYPHTQASPQLSPHFAPSGIGGVQNGAYAQSHSHAPTAARMTYSPVATSHQTTAPYSQPQSQRSNATLAAAMHGQSQHSSLSSYGDSYTAHTTTHSGQYQNPSPTYPDPTIATNYSPAPLSTPQSHDVSRHMSEGPTENGDEDAQGESADESSEIYPNPDTLRLPVSTVAASSSDQPRLGEPGCGCKKGRGKKRPCATCGCTKYGQGCSSACMCGSACGNPFTDLSTFFGPETLFPRPCAAGPCFATWLRNQPNVEELDMDLMVDMLLSDDKSWAQIREYTASFRNWEERWKRTRNGRGKKAKDDHQRLEYELLRGALGDTKPEGFYGFQYSFCQSGWVPSEAWEHCPKCQVCRPSAEWHCLKHDCCSVNSSCPGCASTKLPYHHQPSSQQQSQQQQHQQQHQYEQQQHEQDHEQGHEQDQGHDHEQGGDHQHVHHNSLQQHDQQHQRQQVMYSGNGS